MSKREAKIEELRRALNERHKVSISPSYSFKGWIVNKVELRKKEAVPVLVELLKDEDWRVRKKAVSVLGYMGWKATEAVHPLIETLRGDEDKEVRRNVARALGKIGSEKAISALLEALRDDEDKEVSDAAAEGLGRIAEKLGYESHEELIRAFEQKQ